MSPALEDREYDDRFVAVPSVILSGCAAPHKVGYVSRGASCPGHISLGVLAFQVFLFPPIDTVHLSSIDLSTNNISC